MIIFYLEAKLLFYHSHSLKHRRSMVNSLKDRLKNTFNIAVAEHSGQNDFTETIISVVAISDDKPLLEKLSAKIIDFFDQTPDFETVILDHEYF